MTQEEFIKILPAYQGHQVITTEGRAGILVSIDIAGDAIIASTTGIEIHASKIKLFLRTEDDLTEEEKSILSCIQLDRDAKTYLQAFTKTINYLRSIGIDCDGLINAGYAIHKK